MTAQRSLDQRQLRAGYPRVAVGWYLWEGLPPPAPSLSGSLRLPEMVLWSASHLGALAVYQTLKT